MKCMFKSPELEYIQWTGTNLKEVIEFTGKHPDFDKWFSSWEDYEEYVKSHDNIFKLIYQTHKIPVNISDYIIKKDRNTFNVISEGNFKENYLLVE